MPRSHFSAATHFGGVRIGISSQDRSCQILSTSTVNTHLYSEVDLYMGSPGVEVLIYEAPPSPDYIPGPEGPPSPDYVPGPEEPEQAPPSPIYVPFVPEPEEMMMMRLSPSEPAVLHIQLTRTHTLEATGIRWSDVTPSHVHDYKILRCGYRFVEASCVVLLLVWICVGESSGSWTARAGLDLYTARADIYGFADTLEAASRTTGDVLRVRPLLDEEVDIIYSSAGCMNGMTELYLEPSQHVERIGPSHGAQLAVLMEGRPDYHVRLGTTMAMLIEPGTQLRGDSRDPAMDPAEQKPTQRRPGFLEGLAVLRL
ncbi:hypothetical protein Tco_0561404 [Tanacetum coccineum]